MSIDQIIDSMMNNFRILYPYHAVIDLDLPPMIKCGLYIVGTLDLRYSPCHSMSVVRSILERAQPAYFRLRNINDPVSYVINEVHTKNYRSRIAYITPFLYDVLQEHIRQQLDSGVKSEYVFTYKGKKIKHGIEDSLNTVVRKAGLKDVTLHVLRHTFASQLAIAGVPLRDIQELMGHQSFQTTLQYAHLSEEHIKKQVLRLPFSGSPESFKARIRHVTENNIDILHKKSLVLSLQSK